MASEKDPESGSFSKMSKEEVDERPILETRESSLAFATRELGKSMGRGGQRWVV